jgi:hypothetical protein
MYKPFKISWVATLMSLCVWTTQAQQNSDEASLAQSEDHGIITDRPDATESPNTVEPGYVQIETGGYYTLYEAEGIKSESYGYNTTLARIGLLENMELRLGVNYENNHVTTTMGEASVKTDFKSFSPVLAGIKINLFEGKSFRGGPGKTDFGFLGHLYLPFTTSTPEDMGSGGAEGMPQTTGADFRFSVGHELSDRSGLAYNLGGQWAGDGSGMAFVYTLAYGYSLSERVGAYVELYGDAPELSSANHYWDAGFTYLAGWNLQYDLTFGRSITDGQDLLLSAGLSYKFAY